MLKKKYSLILILALLIVIPMLVAIVTHSFPTRNSDQDQLVQPTRGPMVTNGVNFQRDSTIDKLLAPGTEPTVNQLTAEELQYPEASIQTFPNQGQEHGTLVITSHQRNVKVVIEEPNGSEGSGTQHIPFNIAPFRITKLPPGYYIISAAKENGEPQSVEIIVEPGKVTRVTLSLP
jgi:hypothetical protein